MSDADHPWVLVEWDVIQPGDVVQAPDGAAWYITARIDMPDDGDLTFLLAPSMDATVDESAWTDKVRGSKVNAWRFRDAPELPGAERFAIGRLRLAGFNVAEL